MSTLSELLSFLCRLEQAKISYRIEHNRDEAIMIIVCVPGSRYEIEFFDDGSVEIETFVSTGVKKDGHLLDTLFESYSD